MKTSIISVLLAIVMIFLVGCATRQPQVQIDQDDQVVLAKIAGRHTGSELAKKYPDVASETAKICDKIIEEDNTDIVVTLGKSIVMILTDNQIEDPLLKADIADILEMIDIKSRIVATNEQLLTIKAVAEGLISGIEIAQRQMKE